MKKYVKPAIYCESFRLTEMIAGSCDILCTSTGNTCDIKSADFDMGPFTETYPNCTIKMKIGDNIVFEGYCYWNGENSLFTS